MGEHRECNRGIRGEGDIRRLIHEFVRWPYTEFNDVAVAASKLAKRLMAFSH